MLKAFPPAQKLSSAGRLQELPSNAKNADSTKELDLNFLHDAAMEILGDHRSESDDARLVEAAIRGMLASLDPHSSYLDPKTFRDMQTQTRGEFGGIGTEVTLEEGLIKVVAALDGTPAAKAGILANDIITHIDHEPVKGLSLNQAVEKMRGEYQDQAQDYAQGTGRVNRGVDHP